MKAFRIVSLFMALAVAALFGTAVAATTGLSLSLAVAGSITASLALGHLVPSMPGVLNTTTVNAGTLLAEFNTHYLNIGQNMASLLQSWKQGRTYVKTCVPVYVDGDLHIAAEGTISSILKPFVAPFVGKGDVTIDPIEHALRRIKFDIPLYPDDISGTWAGFLETVGEADRSKWPFVRWVLEKLVAEKQAEESEHADWAGVFNAGGTDYLDTKDGIKTQVVTGLSSGDMNEVAMTTDTTDPAAAFDGLEEFAKGLPNHWRNRAVDILCSPDFELNYFRDKRNTHGANNDYRGESTDLRVDGRPNWRLVPFEGMGVEGDTGALIATPRANRLHMMRRGSFNAGMTVDARLVKLFGDYREAVGFGIGSMVYAHIPAASGSGS